MPGESSKKIRQKFTYFSINKILFQEILCFFFYITRIRVFSLFKKEKMLCHHATFSLIKPKWSENMAKFTHAWYT